VLALLLELVSKLPHEAALDLARLARSLKGRPLSDVAFVVREGARLAARAGRDTLDFASLLKALDNAPPREGGESFSRKIGFT
jgi:cell division protease FtsH